MKYYELTKEEERLVKEVESGEWVRVKNFKQAKKEAQQAARYTLGKTKNINIRLSEKTLQRLKSRAIEQGIPYQTLASSILHQYASS